MIKGTYCLIFEDRRRELSPQNCPLIPILMLWHVCSYVNSIGTRRDRHRDRYTDTHAHSYAKQTEGWNNVYLTQLMKIITMSWLELASLQQWDKELLSRRHPYRQSPELRTYELEFWVI